MKNLKKILSAVFFSISFCAFSEISFENPEINSQDKILFTIKQSITGSPAYSTAFSADAKTLLPAKILTCYPEKMELLSKGSVLQVRNRWGTARYSFSDSTLSWTSRADSIPETAQILSPQIASPDGKWLCYIKKTGIAEGELILKNASTLQETVLDKNAQPNYEKIPVKWNSDSTIFVYEKNGNVYFCEPKAAFQKVQLAEKFRLIGRGNINSVCWANSKNLIYIARDLIYRISSNELYTRGLYSSVIEPGTVCGRLPVVFDEKHDEFSVNSKASAIIFIQSKKIINLFKLNESGFEYVNPVVSKTVTGAGGTVTALKVFWTSDTKCVLWLSLLSYENGAQISAFYSLGSELKFLSSTDSVIEPQLSPDGKKICFAKENSLFVFEANTWTEVDHLSGEKIVSFVWGTDSSVYAGGESTVKKWQLGSEIEKSSLLFLSAASKVFWKSDTVVFAADAVKKDVFYEFDELKGIWTKSSETLAAASGSVQNGKFRVYTGNAVNSNFKNALFVRTLSGKAVTKAYFPQTMEKRQVPAKIILAVDALDDASGLSSILYVLKKYKIPATFFINGEFIRRYPKETVQIAKSGYECGSMFFTALDLTSKDFVVDEDFVRRGLARNEDEFFQTTGKELSLLWHAPFYKADSEVKKAGKNCGYSYVEAGRFSLDTITLEEAARGKPGYLSALELVSFYAQNLVDGSVIPVSTGLSKGTRSDWLYEKLDLLVSLLLSNGYEFVTFNEMF